MSLVVSIEWDNMDISLSSWSVLTFSVNATHNNDGVFCHCRMGDLDFISTTPFFDEIFLFCIQLNCLFFPIYSQKVNTERGFS
jgi:hypothetical protein